MTNTITYYDHTIPAGNSKRRLSTALRFAKNQHPQHKAVEVQTSRTNPEAGPIYVRIEV